MLAGWAELCVQTRVELPLRAPLHCTALVRSHWSLTRKRCSLFFDADFIRCATHPLILVSLKVESVVVS